MTANNSGGRGRLKFGKTPGFHDPDGIPRNGDEYILHNSGKRTKVALPPGLAAYQAAHKKDGTQPPPFKKGKKKSKKAISPDALKRRLMALQQAKQAKNGK
jgi:hypothetical protein